MTKTVAARLAFRFVLAIGVVNLFADMTYEGARAIAGPFLGSLGASAAAVGFVAGFGEFLGYGFRSLSGYLADKTHRYWAVVFAGYAVNMLAVPALALAGNWPIAAVLIVMERTGRALRRPAVETLVSQSGKEIGQGWVFGLNEALDQTGATVGPLITALILYLRGGYRHAFVVLLIPCLLCLGSLIFARLLHPKELNPDRKVVHFLEARGFSKTYWIYFAAGGLVAAGFADFSLIAFHFQKTAIVSQSSIPALYSVAMVSEAVASLVFGRLLDKYGRPVVLTAFSLPVLYAPFVFLGGFGFALAGMLLWGIGMASQNSLLKALLAGIVPSDRRGTGFGLFDTGFGIAWFIGSAAMGLTYSLSIPGLVLLSVVLQLTALPFFAFAVNRTSG